MNKLISPETGASAQAYSPCGGTYVPPATTMVCVETEGAFCGSIFGPEKDEHDTGLSIEEHGFANPGMEFEYGANDKGEPTDQWDKF